MSALLEELVQATPGASDADREAWLAERRSGITATQVRDLWLEKHGMPTFTTWRELIDLKLGRKPEVDLSYKPHIRWGQVREPVIAEQLRVNFDIEPESRVWRAKVNPRHLASPDGIGVGFEGLELSEIKTTSNDKTLYSEHFNDAGYLAQIVWQMYVLGAWRCLYAFEYRLGHAGSYEPGALVTSYPQDGRLTTAWVYADEHKELLAELIEIADAFLADLDQKALEPFDEPEIDEEIDTLAVNYLAALEAEKREGDAKKAHFDSLKDRMHDRGSVEFLQESPLARVSFKPGRESTETETVYDMQAAKAAHPVEWAALEAARVEAQACEEAWESLMRLHSVSRTVTKRGRETLTITKGKGLKK